MKKLQLNSWQRQALRWVGVFSFYLLCLFVFFRLTFPYERLKERVVAEFNRAQPDKRLEIDEMSGHWLFGVEAQGVRLISLAAPAADAAPSAPFSLESVDASVSLLAYVFGTLNVSFGAELGGGEVSGNFRQSDTESSLEFSIEKVDVSGLAAFTAGLGLPLTGSLGGQVELLLPERKMTKAEGRVELRIVDLVVGDGKAKIRNTIALPRLNAGEFSLKADVAAGRLDVKEFGATGSDFEMTADGKVRLREPFDRSIADLTVAFRFKEAYTTKSDLTKSIFGTPDGKVPGLFDMDPQARQAKGDDGFYRWRVTGALSHPSFRPGNKAAAPSSAPSEE